MTTRHSLSLSSKRQALTDKRVKDNQSKRAAANSENNLHSGLLAYDCQRSLELLVTPFCDPSDRAMHHNGRLNADTVMS